MSLGRNGRPARERIPVVATAKVVTPRRTTRGMIHEQEIAFPHVENRVRQAARSGSSGWRSTRLVSGRRLRGNGGARLSTALGRRHLDRGDQFGNHCRKRAPRSGRKTSRILGAGFVSLGELARSAA